MFLALLLCQIAFVAANPFHKYPYVFLLDVGNEEIKKTNTEKIRVSVPGGSIALRYPGTGTGDTIAHVRVSGIDFGTDLKANIVDGGPGYKYVVLVFTGNQGSPYDAVVTVQTVSDEDIDGNRDPSENGYNYYKADDGANDSSETANESVKNINESANEENNSAESTSDKLDTSDENNSNSLLPQQSSNVYSYTNSAADGEYSNNDDDNTSSEEETNDDLYTENNRNINAEVMQQISNIYAYAQSGVYNQNDKVKSNEQNINGQYYADTDENDDVNSDENDSRNSAGNDYVQSSDEDDDTLPQPNGYYKSQKTYVDSNSYSPSNRYESKDSSYNSNYAYERPNELNYEERNNNDDYVNQDEANNDFQQDFNDDYGNESFENQDLNKRADVKLQPAMPLRSYDGLRVYPQYAVPFALPNANSDYSSNDVDSDHANLDDDSSKYRDPNNNYYDSNDASAVES